MPPSPASAPPSLISPTFQFRKASAAGTLKVMQKKNKELPRVMTVKIRVRKTKVARMRKPKQAKASPRTANSLATVAILSHRRTQPNLVLLKPNL